MAKRRRTGKSAAVSVLCVVVVLLALLLPSLMHLRVPLRPQRPRFDLREWSARSHQTARRGKRTIGLVTKMPIARAAIVSPS